MTTIDDALVRDVLQSVSDVLFPQDLGERRVEIDSRSSEGDTPLHVMAWRNDRAGAELLVKAGADVNAVGDMNETPLHVAVTQEDEDFIELLLRASANPDLRCEFGDTARERALAKGGRLAELFATA